MDRTCQCGGHISSYIQFNDLAECCDCHKCYIRVLRKWIYTPKDEFRVIYRKRLIEYQKVNK